MGAVRWFNQFVQNDVLEGTVLAFDGSNYFHAARGNLFTSGYTLTQANLEKQLANMRLVNDMDGIRIGVKPAYLLHPPSLTGEAHRLCKSPNLGYLASTTGYTMASNPNFNVVEPICLDFLTEHATPTSSTWYLAASPDDFIGLMVAFLPGGKMPTILRTIGAEVVAGGGRELYDIPFNELMFKVRWDVGGQLVEPWALQKNTV